MRELNLDQLRTLVAIADLGTFSAAARALHLAQPTVSLHVSELESRLGTPLVVRGSRRVSPTAAGAALIDRARRLLRDADEAVDTVKRHAKGQDDRAVAGDLLLEVGQFLLVRLALLEVVDLRLGYAEAILAA